MITQVELAELSSLQAAEWMAAQNAHKAALKVVERLRAGAGIEDGPLTFDTELKMVRSKKGKAG